MSVRVLNDEIVRLWLHNLIIIIFGDTSANIYFQICLFFSARLCFLSQPNKRPCVLGCWYSMTRILIRNVRGGKLREGILIFDNPIKKKEARHSYVCLRQPLLFVTDDVAV